MTELNHKKVLILREHDVKKTSLKKLKYKMLDFYDLDLKSDFYKDVWAGTVIKECEKKGYPVLLQLEGKIRLLIFNRETC